MIPVVTPRSLGEATDDLDVHADGIELATVPGSGSAKTSRWGCPVAPEEQSARNRGPVNRLSFGPLKRCRGQARLHRPHAADRLRKGGIVRLAVDLGVDFALT
jgi:hypothetical protein